MQHYTSADCHLMRDEIGADVLEDLCLRGGFPRSILAASLTEAAGHLL